MGWSHTVAQGDVRIVDPLYSIQLDEALGLIRVSRIAVQHDDQMMTYIAALDGVIETAYRRIGLVRMLVDLRGAPVRSQDATRRLREYNATKYRADDRIALVVESALLKMQLRRLAVIGLHELFDDAAAAERWLRTD